MILGSHRTLGVERQYMTNKILNTVWNIYIYITHSSDGCLQT